MKRLTCYLQINLAPVLKYSKIRTNTYGKFMLTSVKLTHSHTCCDCFRVLQRVLCDSLLAGMFSIHRKIYSGTCRHRPESVAQPAHFAVELTHTHTHTRDCRTFCTCEFRDCVASISSALYMSMMEWMRGRVAKNEESKENGER